MTTRQTENHDLDRLMRQWMDDEATVHVPADLVDRIFAGTRRSRQLPAWLVFDRWTQMQLTMRRASVPRLTPLLLLLGLLIAALLATLVFVGSRPKLPPPFGVAANGRIAFLSGEQIYTVEPDGSGMLQLTTDPFGTATPVFSHDGTRIAYRRLPANPSGVDPTSLGDLVVTGADGSNPIVIETLVEGMSPTAWSPDDREVLWSGTTTGGPEQIYVAPADGSSPPVRIGDRDTSNWGPGWSPDGTKIAYISENSLYVMKRDGTDIRNASRGTYAEQSGGSWNPVGSGLVFSAGPQGDHDLWLVGLDGKPEHVLAKSVRSEDRPVFSPDGEWIAFVRFASDGQSTQVVVVRADGADERTLPGSYGFSGVMWSPDGTRLLVGGLNPPSDIFELDPFGSVEPRLLELPGSLTQSRADQYGLPAWQRRAQ